MGEYRPCECPYHDDGDGFIGGGDCPNEARIRTARYGWLCAECYDQLRAAWADLLEHRDEPISGEECARTLRGDGTTPQAGERRKDRMIDVSETLCDACLARLEQWLAGEAMPHEFLEVLLILG